MIHRHGSEQPRARTSLVDRLNLRIYAATRAGLQKNARRWTHGLHHLNKLRHDKFHEFTSDIHEQRSRFARGPTTDSHSNRPLAINLLAQREKIKPPKQRQHAQVFFSKIYSLKRVPFAFARMVP